WHISVRMHQHSVICNSARKLVRKGVQEHGSTRQSRTEPHPARTPPGHGTPAPPRGHRHEPRGGRAPARVVDLYGLPHRDRPQPGNVRVLLELYGVTGPNVTG